MTSCPRATANRTTAEPMKPAPPVTSNFMSGPFPGKRTIEISHQWCDGVLVRQDRLPLKAPVDPDIRVVEADGAFGFRRVIVGAFVNDLGIRLAGDETVQEPRRDHQLLAVLKAQFDPDPFAEGRAALADIDR